eukprot:288637_1
MYVVNIYYMLIRIFSIFIFVLILSLTSVSNSYSILYSISICSAIIGNSIRIALISDITSSYATVQTFCLSLLCAAVITHIYSLLQQCIAYSNGLVTAVLSLIN